MKKGENKTFSYLLHNYITLHLKSKVNEENFSKIF